MSGKPETEFDLEYLELAVSRLGMLPNSVEALTPKDLKFVGDFMRNVFKEVREISRHRSFVGSIRLSSMNSEAHFSYFAEKPGVSKRDIITLSSISSFTNYSVIFFDTNDYVDENDTLKDMLYVTYDNLSPIDVLSDLAVAVGELRKEI